MPQYLTPGVYVEELLGGTRPIEGVGTNVAAFLGQANDADARAGIPTAVNNWTQYTNVFGSTGPSTPLTLAVHGFFLNGGQRCYVLNLGEGGSITGTPSRPGISALEPIDEIAIVAAPGYTDAASYDAVLSHCELMKDRVAVIDIPETVDDLNDLTVPATASGTSTAEPPSSSASSSESSGASSSSSDVGGDADAVGDADEPPPPPAPRRAAASARDTGLAPRQSEWGAAYGPWPWVVDPLTGTLVLAPPSGHVAGVWARTDASRGVHKAPANETLRGAVDLKYAWTPSEQGLLNTSGINAIRIINGSIRIWGARTLAGSSSEWRYLPVRRLFAFAEESIQQGTGWVVFEPNDVTLWNAVSRDIRAFLRRLWRDGALFGTSEREAFYVKCDRETNPEEDVDAGLLTALVGMAPVKPAEFIVFKVSQYAAGSAGGEEAS
ncbi:phage tail sheath subtilisin-like domain-containing protein [Microbacterium sp. zg.Y625]|uniref:phage tail sheath family protein n=1 Tax=Microbacterium jiangjiandongii TaxID=3049071 RepID=UPI00214BAFFB|nr:MULTISPECIES: phage tail sheath subtilisin-like domain-containing protein [unclassified Microbacterium]MCR2792315.1 phage tail sheath subtilisin-like domain-containing protein [Microbacterium sp. zg.Y625]WIM25110.1 phage tail sheath subtilisin-like domain-containing protein [Microbacterium sp. zg-Y625]